MKTRFWFMMPAALAAVSALAVETKTWTQSEAPEFDKGTLKGLALSSEGRVSLAPTWRERFDAAVPHLWCAASDSKGTVYTGGSEGKVFAVDAQGKGRALATLEGGAVYAMAVTANDELFAAVSPAAKIYRVDAAGKATLFASLKARYVWALIANADGTFYAATGDPGQIHKIAADGQASVFFDAEETHVRALAADGKGNLIAGTEPGGVVLRVSPAGAGFVLYQTAKREVTALLATRQGIVYAAASGNRGAAAPVIPAGVGTVPVTTPAATGAAAVARPVTPPPPTFTVAPPAGGSEIYQIDADGAPRRVWANTTLMVYALGLDRNGMLLAATGNQGRLYRVDSEFSSTRLIDAEPQQITALAAGRNGALIAVTANPAKVFEVGPGLEKTGTLESELLDAGTFTYWGRLRHEAALNGGAVKLEARSGNLDRAQKNWSEWSLVDAAKGSRITAPPARFLGWRATFTVAPDGKSPVLKLVEAAYQAKNTAPALERIEMTPANQKFPVSSSSLTSTSTATTLPAMGQPKRAAATTPTSTETGAASVNFDQGWMGARWRASDANGDTLEYKVEIRGAEEREWKLLKDKLKDSRFSFDGTGFADGRYLLRVTANDETDNYPGQGLQAQIETEEFVIDNTPPDVAVLAARVDGGKLMISFKAADALTALQYAEFSVNGGEWISARPTTGITDSLAHEYAVETAKPAGAEFTVAVKVADENDNVTVRKVTVR
ncbi:MAG: hypothetical protein IPP47_02850 [Bryobacterales bacterium]|nr:hypothetical protein [Bryobacterales bacterium]